MLFFKIYTNRLLLDHHCSKWYTTITKVWSISTSISKITIAIFKIKCETINRDVGFSISTATILQCSISTILALAALLHITSQANGLELADNLDLWHTAIARFVVQSWRITIARAVCHRKICKGIVIRRIDAGTYKWFVGRLARATFFKSRG